MIFQYLIFRSMKFLRYPSFLNHYKTKFVDSLKSDVGVTTFIATEKLHGSNFAVYHDGTEFRYARRNGFLEETENFHESKRISETHKPDFAKIYNFCKDLYTGTSYVIIYGEIVGDGVQASIKYTNQNAFYIFDICIVESYNDHEVYKFLSYNDFLIATTMSNLKTAPVIKRGTIEELLQLNPAFTSTVMDVNHENPAEGYVLKTEREEVFSTEVDDFEIERHMIKFKNPKFDETANVPKKKTSKEKVDTEFFDIHLTFNRLCAVKSKLSAKQAKNKKELAEHLYLDALLEVAKSEYDLPIEVSGACRKAAEKFVNANFGMLKLGNQELMLIENILKVVGNLDANWFKSCNGESKKTVGEARTLILKEVSEKVGAIPKIIMAPINKAVLEKAKEFVMS